MTSPSAAPHPASGLAEFVWGAFMVYVGVRLIRDPLGLTESVRAWLFRNFVPPPAWRDLAARSREAYSVMGVVVIGYGAYQAFSGARSIFGS